MKTARPLADRASFPAEGFVEGLWEHDVAEFFLLDRRRGTYQEYNLSPGGAWWAAAFSAPRVRLDPQPDLAAFGPAAAVCGPEPLAGRFPARQRAREQFEARTSLGQAIALDGIADGLVIRLTHHVSLR